MSDPGDEMWDHDDYPPGFGERENMTIHAKIFDANAMRYLPEPFSLFIGDGVAFAPLEPFMYGVQITTPVQKKMPSTIPDDPPQIVKTESRVWTMTKANHGWEVQCLSVNCQPIGEIVETTKEWGNFFFELCNSISNEAESRSRRAR